MEHQDGSTVLILYYSFSNQTQRMIHVAEEVFDREGIPYHKERIRPIEPLEFPVNSIPKTFLLMIKTFFRWRVPIEPISDRARETDYGLVVVAGPTWSYNPSGPILSFLDQYGQSLLPKKKVLPIISCRSYWKSHFRYLKKRISALGGEVMDPVVLKHPLKEPWKTLGVFLTIAGKNPKRMPLLKKHYVQYGHTREQLEGLRRRLKGVVEEIHGKA